MKWGTVPVNGRRRTGEFERIARYFAPLAAGHPGAFGLADDAAVLRPGPGNEFVVTTDTLVAGVHYVGDEDAGSIARKLRSGSSGGRRGWLRFRHFTKWNWRRARLTT